MAQNDLLYDAEKLYKEGSSYEPSLIEKLTSSMRIMPLCIMPLYNIRKLFPARTKKYFITAPPRTTKKV
jgi:hypothetical protein